MALDPSIILAGRSPDMINALAGGVQAGQQMRAAQTQNALSDLYRTQGAGIMAGQQPALNALAQISPEAALGIQGARQQMDARALDMSATRQSMYVLGAQERRAIADHAAKLSEAERKAQSTKIEDVVKMGLDFYHRGDRVGFDAFVKSQGADPSEIKFDMIPALANKYRDVADVLKQYQPPVPLSPQGKFRADQAAGLVPAGEEYKGGGTTVNVGPNGSKFTEESDKLAAQRFGEIVQEGQNSARVIGDLQAISGLAGQIDTGKGAELMLRFAPYAELLGVSIDGLPEAQAYQAIVDRLAPQMRTPGAGATSDFDAKQFLSSLPNLARTTEGNAIINETLQSVHRQKLAAAEIAREAQSGALSWQEAERKMAALGNPFEVFNRAKDKITGGAPSAPKKGEIRKGYRFNGGDPAEQSNWEKVE